MTRIFTDGGEHLPVTVLKVDACQVIDVRTFEKNGYVAVQVGAGTLRLKMYLNPCVGISPFEGCAEAKGCKFAYQRMRC